MQSAKWGAPRQDARLHPESQQLKSAAKRASARGSVRQRPTDMAGAAAKENRGKIAQGAKYGAEAHGVMGA